MLEKKSQEEKPKNSPKHHHIPTHSWLNVFLSPNKAVTPVNYVPIDTLASLHRGAYANHLHRQRRFVVVLI
jgi:hypothetical protein